jgi:hypothetical protein
MMKKRTFGRQQNIFSDIWGTDSLGIEYKRRIPKSSPGGWLWLRYR